MKPFLIAIIIAIIPIISLIVINETVRSTIEHGESSYHGAKRMNTNFRLKTKCTWACHDHTKTFCQKYHVKYVKAFFPLIDPFYYNIIDFLKIGGNYDLANIILFVVVSPLIIFFFLYRTIYLTFEINQLKKQRNARSI